MGILNKRRRKLLWKAIGRMDANTFSWKYLRNRWRWLQLDKTKSTEIPHPTNFMLELGNVCNLHCVTCPREYEYGKAMDVGFMPTDKAKGIIDEVLPYLDSIGLTGLGETFMYPHLLDIARYIKQRKRSVIVTVSTNAHFKGFVEKITPVLPYIDNIQFSVDGVGAVYETIRPGTDFDFIKNNIKETMSRGRHVEYMINCVVSDRNCQDMAGVVRLAAELGVTYVNFNVMSIASMPARERSFYDYFKSETFAAALRDLEAAKRQYPQIEVTGPEPPARPNFQDCAFPWSYPYITWDGYYVPCCGKPFPKLLNFGNVFAEGGVMKVLNSDRAQAFRRQWQENKAPGFCHNCQFVDF